MSRSDVRAIALRCASKCGVPYVHKTGRHVSLVLSMNLLRNGRLEGDVLSVECASGGEAHEVRHLVFAALEHVQPPQRRVLLDRALRWVRTREERVQLEEGA